MFLTVPVTIMPSSRWVSVSSFWTRHLLLEHRLARQHDVGAAAVEVDDARLDLLADVVLEPPGRPQVDQRAGQERPHADVDRQAALDALEHLAANRCALAVRRLQDLPDAHLGRALARQPDLADHLVEALDQDVHLVAGLDRDLALAVDELGARDQSPRT